jgi:hypothetical protein
MFVFFKQGLQGLFSYWIRTDGLVIGRFEGFNQVPWNKDVNWAGIDQRLAKLPDSFMKKGKSLKPKKREGMLNNSFALRRRPRMS